MMLEFLSWLNSTLHTGLPYCIVTLSFVLTFRYINFPDITCAGTFVAGAAAAAYSAVSLGVAPIVALCFAMLVGSLGGGLTSFFFSFLRIEKLLAGVLSAFVLYALAMQVLQPTLAYGATQTVFDAAIKFDRALTFGRVAWHAGVVGVLLFVVVGVKLLMDFVLASEFGLALRALEDEEAGPSQLERHGLSPSHFRTFALVAGNALVGLAGGLVSMQEGAANLHRGFDVLITGLVAFLLGTQLRDWLPRVVEDLSNSRLKAILTPVSGLMSRLRVTSVAALGAVLYFGIVALSHRLLVPPEFTKLSLAGLVALTVGDYRRVGEKIQIIRKRRAVARSSGAAHPLQGRRTDDLSANGDGSRSCAAEVADLSFSYDGASSAVLRNISLRLQVGEVVSLTGANGSGKTTLLKLLAGYLEAPAGGRIRLGSRDVTYSPRLRRLAISYLAQHAQNSVVRTFSVEENLALGGFAGKPSIVNRALSGAVRKRIERLLLEFGFVESDIAVRRACTLSGGQRQVVNILAFLARPRLAAAVLLDEPFNNLDADNARKCWEAVLKLRGGGASVVIVNHLASVPIVVDRVVDLGSVF